MKKKNTKLFEWQKATKTKIFHCCKCERQEYITVDHIIPCFLIEQFFRKDDIKYNELRYYWLYNNEQNFRYLCKFCADKKGSHLDFDEPLTKQLLLELINLI